MINHPFLKLIKVYMDYLSAQTIDSAATLVLIGSEANRSMQKRWVSPRGRGGACPTAFILGNGFFPTDSTAFYISTALSLIFSSFILSFHKKLLEKAWCNHHVKPSVTTTSPCFFFALDARASHAGPATSWLGGSTSLKVETRVDCQTSYWHDCDNL